MATTSLWRVHGWLGKVVVYVENPAKTDNPKFYEKEGMTEQGAQGMEDVIEYAVQARKTVARTNDEAAVAVARFVDGVNCNPLTARDSMMKTKQEFEKTGGVVAYHGYQAFAPGEATPEMAHEIGMKLARQLWGDKYQVLVATHLDKANLLHNHFIINTVSHIDGKKFHRTEKDYYAMQRASDALCREYGLSVIEEPQRGKSKHYAELDAEQKGEPTYRSMVKADVDRAIAESLSERQFWENLKKLGYHFKFGQDITVRPPGKERGLKLRRNFGEEYSIERIRRRILAHDLPQRQAPPPPEPRKQQYRTTGNLYTVRRSTGLRALYFYYLYRMGVLPKRREPSPKSVYFLLREDIRHVRNISLETRLLVTHGIDTSEQLAAYKNTVTAQIAALSASRRELRLLARSRTNDETRVAVLKSEIAALTKQIGRLHREVKLCEDIEKRSAEMVAKLRQAQESEKPQGKERTSHESLRRRR